MSTSKEVLLRILTEDRTVKNLDFDDLPIERALGIQWDVEHDALRIKAVLSPKRLDGNTHRGCLSTLGSTFDPFGLIAPVVLLARLILQKTWQTGLEWDDNLPEDLQEHGYGTASYLIKLSADSVVECSLVTLYFYSSCLFHNLNCKQPTLLYKCIV